jgi:uncharacterized membrane protein YecN with MAPEG domain
MPVPVWVLLGFAVWTLLLLFGSVGVYRWSRILTGRIPISEFKADQVEGADWYKRAMRAHANCVENLPIVGAIVLVLYISGTGGGSVDVASLFILGGRLLQSLVHLCFVQTNTIVAIRFGFYFIQAASYFYLAAAIVNHVLLEAA